LIILSDEHVVETRTELAVAIMDQESEAGAALFHLPTEPDQSSAEIAWAASSMIAAGPLDTTIGIS
jgi:hypothetical protein